MTSKTTNKYSPEVRERAVRMVLDHECDHASRWAAVVSLAAKIGCAAQTLHDRSLSTASATDPYAPTRRQAIGIAAQYDARLRNTAVTTDASSSRAFSAVCRILLARYAATSRVINRLTEFCIKTILSYWMPGGVEASDWQVWGGSMMISLQPRFDIRRSADGVPYSILVLVGCCFTTSTMAQAQGVPAAPVPDSAQATSIATEIAARDEPEQGEIVVTAQKRVQRINDVGITVTALGGQALQDRQINSLADLAQAVPGLSFSQSGANTPVYTLRGIGFYETSLAAYPAVSVYLDEAPLPFPVLTRLTAFDLERVEVLKGPQGTLFGQNATGGALNFIAAKPTRQPTAGVSMGYGRFNTFTAEAFASGPITDALLVRVSGKVVRSGDWQKSYTTDMTTGDTKTYAGRILLDWRPTERLQLQLNLNGWKDESEPQAIQYIAYSPQFPVPNPIVGYPFSPRTPRSADFSRDLDHHTVPYPRFRLGKIITADPFAPPRIDNRLLQGIFRADLELTDAITLTSLTSYIDYKHLQGFDGDGLTLNSFDVPYDEGYIKSFSQEVRLASGTGPFRWVVGGNYGRDKVFEDFLLDFASSSVQSAAGLTDGGNFNLQIMNNYAAFANGELDFGAFTFKAGLRYTEAKRRYDGCTFVTPDSGGPGLFTFLSNTIRDAKGLPRLPPLKDFDCQLLDADGVFTRVRRELNEDNISYRAGLDWKPNRDVLVYANITKGYKAGSFPSVAASTTVQVEAVTEESVLSYEIGTKVTLAGGKLQANAAAFYYDYKDKQLRSKLIDSVFGLLDDLVNIPKSTVKGFELEFVANPIDSLSTYLNFTYTDAKIDEFTGFNAGGQLADFAGGAVPYTPEYQVSTGGEYAIPVSSNAAVFVGGDLTFRSKATAIVGGGRSLRPVASIPGTPDVYAIDDYTLIDLRVGIKTADDRLRFQLWGKNVTDKYYWTNVVAFYDTIGRYTGRPATYGATLSYRFQ